MSIADVIIRSASPHDAHAVCEYMNILADENLDQLSGLRPVPEEERVFLQKASQTDCAIFLIALKDGIVVGTLDLWPREHSANRHAGRLGMSVRAAYRRQGIGRKLLEAVISEAKSWAGFNRIELEVTSSNEPAICLYESSGFVRTGTTATFFKGKPVDLILMALDW